MDPRFHCAGCGAVPADPASPFRCAAARDGDDVDHVIERTTGDGATGGCGETPSDAPFERYRMLLPDYQRRTGRVPRLRARV